MPCSEGGSKRVEDCSGAGAKIKMRAGRSGSVVVEEVGKELMGVCWPESHVLADIEVGFTKKESSQLCYHLVRF